MPRLGELIGLASAIPAAYVGGSLGSSALDNLVNKERVAKQKRAKAVLANPKSSSEEKKRAQALLNEGASWSSIIGALAGGALGGYGGFKLADKATEYAVSNFYKDPLT